MGEIKQRKTQFIQRVQHDTLFALSSELVVIWAAVLHKLFVASQMFFLL